MSRFIPLFLLAFLVSNSALAEIVINCANKKNTIKWQYSIKAGGSSRLGSDIVLQEDGNINVLSTARVAQYVATNQQLFMIIDDASENIAYRFSADKPGKKPFVGKLEIANPKTSHTLTCTAVTN